MSDTQAKRRLTPSHVFAEEHRFGCCKGRPMAHEKAAKSLIQRHVGLKECTSINA